MFAALLFTTLNPSARRYPITTWVKFESVVEVLVKFTLTSLEGGSSVICSGSEVRTIPLLTGAVRVHPQKKKVASSDRNKILAFISDPFVNLVDFTKKYKIRR